MAWTYLTFKQAGCHL